MKGKTLGTNNNKKKLLRCGGKILTGYWEQQLGDPLFVLSPFN